MAPVDMALGAGVVVDFFIKHSGIVAVVVVLAAAFSGLGTWVSLSSPVMVAGGRASLFNRSGVWAIVSEVSISSEAVLLKVASLLRLGLSSSTAIATDFSLNDSMVLSMVLMANS